jgi:hypothetical protein
VQAGSPLFETIVVFEQHDLAAALRTLDGTLPHGSIQLYEQTSLPLALSVYGGADWC